ncbi:transcciptional activator PmfR [Paenarthrobacter ureafaciens]|uniref:transcciptional activator PmfR n=1 Tax=Paenarthrobacter ureafaciens TaxID=37931 RepID=UPI001C2BDEF2|nr:PucR family transcriptional regulator [Paenarthrobacter ureafaciens]
MEQQVLTVRDLVTAQSLGMKVLSGAGGLDRQVLWAHSCELSDPDRWLGPHELLMTVGLCVPHSAVEQRNFIVKLDEAGLSGVALGDHNSLPPLTRELYEEADRRSFPVLLTNQATPFAAIGRTVAAATATTQTMQVLKLSKLYQLSTYARTDPLRMMNDLQALLRAGLSVFDVQTGLTIVEGAPLEFMPTSVRERTYALPGDSDSRLMISEYPGEEVSSFLLIHVLQVIDVALSQLLRSLRRRSERSTQMLASIFEGRSPDGLGSILGPSGTSSGYQFVAVALEDSEKVARAASIKSLSVLAGPGSSSFFILMPEQSRNDVRNLLHGLDVRAGVSSTYLDLRDAKAAADEAAKIFSSGGTNGLWTDFTGVPVSLLTRSRKEASAIVQQVLGRLAGTDPKITVLRETLFAFLANDRRWNETAAALGIHRQTLSYRLTRIKEITGRDIASSADLSAFWLAFQAWPSFSDRSD